MIYSDDFSVDLSNWTQITGTWSIEAGAATQDGTVPAGPAIMVYNTVAASVEHFSQALIQSNGVSGFNGVFICGDGITTNGYYAKIVSSTERAEIFRLYNGVATLIDSVGVNPSSPFKLRFERAGVFTASNYPGLNLYLNDTLLLDTYDYFIDVDNPELNGNYFGVIQEGSQSGQLLSDFKGGNNFVIPTFQNTIVSNKTTSGFRFNSSVTF